MVDMVHSGLTASIPVAGMSALIARLEAAKEGGRELDGLVARAFGWHRVEPRHMRGKAGGWIAPQDFIGLHGDGSPMLDSLHGTDIHRDPPRVTTSIDAALALSERVLPGYLVNLCQSLDRWDASLDSEDDVYAHGAHAKTGSLALCIAILRAKLDGYEAEGGVNQASCNAATLQGGEG